VSTTTASVANRDAVKCEGGERPCKELIVAEEVGKTFQVGRVSVPALRKVSLRVAAGDFLFVTGRNGAGKSTLLHCLAARELPDTGKIVIGGQDIASLSQSRRSELRIQRFGYVFQEPALIAELTALENVMLPAMVLHPKPEARRRALEQLARVGLASHANHSPGQLSGGQQQRTVIARALVNDPDILFVDEPTSSLDTVASRELLETFARLNRVEHHTIVMVSHEEGDATYANRLILMCDGEITEDRSLS
jgi:putative ABC transport system ATP-binding protein